MHVIKTATTKTAQEYPNEDNLLHKYQSVSKNSKQSLKNEVQFLPAVL